ncbi:MAG TPA: response regulator [Pyrinomonadaceae bacterium]|nr:response regulator [Pyrinomonadaceae bacterium]
MKLDFETQTTADFLTGGSTETIDSIDVSEKLPAGIKAAQEGDRAGARILLLQATEAEPDNEDAWLWLASISEYPEELLGFLNNVLNINPENERALDWAKATKSMLSKTFLQRGIDASRENQNNFAKQCFSLSIVNDSENETAWLWLASVSEEIEEKNACLEKVLLLNPENETALDSIETVKQQMAESRLPQAIAFAFAGESEAARETIEQILASSPEAEDALLLKSYLVESLGEKIACYEKVLEINPSNATALVNVEFLSSTRAKLNVEAAQKDAGEIEQFFDVSIVEDEAISAESDKETEDIISADEKEVENFVEPEGEELSAGENRFAGEVFEEVSPNEPKQTNIASDFSHDTKVGFQEDENIHESQKESAAESEENDERFDLNDAEENVFEEFDQPGDDNAENDGEINFAPEESELSFGEDGEVFEVPETEASLDSLAASDEFANIYAEYAADKAEASENSESMEAEEISPVEDALPSYYETEDAVLSNSSAGNEVRSTEFFAPEEINQEDEAVEAAEEESFAPIEDFDTEVSSKQSIEKVACPFCSHENETQAFACGSCEAALSLSDLETLLAHRESGEAVRRAVEEMEAVKNLRELDADELKILGVGQMNLKDFDSGLAHLRQAARMNPNDVVFGSQVNTLAIRLAEIEEQTGASGATQKNKTILVVDDSATVRKLIAGKLEKSGHAVLCAVDGMDALEKIKEVTPDLILLDIVMPQMDGYQVCKLIRGSEKTRNVPVVMISGKDGFFDKVRGRMAGTTGYITKPFGPETLMKTIESYIIRNDSID